MPSRRSFASAALEPVPGVSSRLTSVVEPGGPVRPELAELARLGRRVLRGAISAARADEAPTLPRLIHDHLGPEAAAAPVVSGAWPSYEHVNVQLGLDAWLSAPGRSHTLVGISGFQHRMFGLADLVQPETARHGPGVGAPALADHASGPSGATRACVQCGLYLVENGAAGPDRAGGRQAVLLRGGEARGPEESVIVEVMCATPGVAERVVADVRRLALERSVYRGQIVSFGSEMFDEPAVIRFHERPRLGRSRLVLPPGMLETIERQVVGVARHRERLRASGQHLKRGILLYGAPGTGKTHTVRYLLGQLTGVTTVLLSGGTLHLVGQACSIARTLQPTIIVVEDVDLIAEERDASPGGNPLLFELLNEMDGLDDDVDVAFVLTTNRADLLEPALATRPGRVDQAVELPVPDADARRQLIELYKGGLRLTGGVGADVIDRTEGVTAAFLKELLRRAALLAADRARDGEGPLTVTGADLAAALDVLLSQQNQLTRTLLGGTRPGPSVGP